MKYGNIFATSISICLSTALVVGFAFMRPDYAALIVAVYLLTILLMTILVFIIGKIYLYNKEAVNTDDFIKITEELNTEVVVWTDDFSFIRMNKVLRQHLALTDDDFDKKEMMKKVFGLPALNSEAVMLLTEGSSHEVTFTNAEGISISIAWSTSLIKKHKKNKIYLSTGFNQTENKKMRIKLASANEFFNSSMELAEIGILMSKDRETFAASTEMLRMFGLKKHNMSFSDFKKLIDTDDRLVFERAIKTADESITDVQCIDLKIRRKDSTVYRWYSFRYKSIAATDNTLPLLGGALMDITQEREKDIRIENLAFRDEVTGIYNRNKLVSEGQKIYECCDSLECSYWIIVLDIDRFHIVNDTCGYSNGNYILREFANIILKYVNRTELAARISGDNFALILRAYGDDELPIRTAKSIQEEFAKLAVNEFAAISLSCSAGFSKIPDDGNSFLDVMEHAEFALKSMNKQGHICGYEPSMHDSIISNTELEKSLALAIDNNELQLFYQPKIDLRTNKIMGVEALIRWIKPDGTIITPDAFIPLAESCHLIGRISEYALNEGCRQNKMWQKMGFDNIVMSINFTASDFYQNDLEERVFEALAKAKLEPEWLEVELTETLALSDIDYAVSQMNKLRNLGVKLAMDDFGTGYSSLSYLQILPITLLKLDRSFIIDIQHDDIAFEIVSAVISIAKSKKIKTIAEGIENFGQEDILRKAGCDYGQGFLYGKPMPPQELEALMRKMQSNNK